MSRIINQLKRNQTFYLAIGTTITMILYAQFVLGHYSTCFSISGTSNSLGLTFGYNLHMVQDFFKNLPPEWHNCFL